MGLALHELKNGPTGNYVQRFRSIDVAPMMMGWRVWRHGAGDGLVLHNAM
jgi:hypothetical protein